jgi:hypothetical protein
MAVIKGARIAVGKTVNLGNFNSIRVDAEVSVDLADGETLPEVTEMMQGELREFLERTYRAQKKGELV